MRAAVLLCLSAMISAAPAAQAAGRLAVLPAVVAGPHGEASAGQVFEATVKGLGLRIDVDIVGYDALFLQGATSKVTEAGRCGSDETCVRRVVAEAGATMGLRSIVNFALDPPLITLSLIETDASRPPLQAVLEAQGRWDLAVATAVDTLMLQRGLSPAGRLQVACDESATVSFPGNPPFVAEGPRQFRLPPGQHTVRITGPQGASAESRVLVTAHQTVRLQQSLPPVVAQPEQDSGSIFTSGWFWGAVGVVVVGAATAAVVAADPFAGDPGAGCLCVTTANGPCGTCP